MMLPKDDPLTPDYLRIFPDSAKSSSSYMPPIRSNDKSAKHFLSPAQFQSTRRLSPYVGMQSTPKRDFSNTKLEPLSGMYPTFTNDRSLETSVKMNIDRLQALNNSIKQKAALRGGLKVLSRPGEHDSDGPQDSPRVSAAQDDPSKKQSNDPGATFQTFVSRLNKLQVNSILPNMEPIRFSDKSHGHVKGFGVCTNQGLVRNYNEDRVSVILNIPKPANRPTNEYWPTCSMFGVFDGHGGYKCAEFLRNNLHQYVLKNKNFPSNPQEAIKEAFEEADKDFLENVLIESDGGVYDKSGSCCIFAVILDDTCYIGNVGDSRAVLCQSFGNSCYSLSRDHKPCDKQEQKRIVDAGGKVYQNFPTTITGKRIDLDPKNNPLNLQVPFRILPGRLSVSRSFGDIEAKMTRFGGNPNVLISKPEITTLKISKEHDFILLASDGVFDKLTNEELVSSVWSSWGSKRDTDIHLGLKVGAEQVIKEAMLSKSLDNVTGILIALPHLESYFSGSTPLIRDLNLNINTNLSSTANLNGVSNSAQLPKQDMLNEVKNEYYNETGVTGGHTQSLSQRFGIGTLTPLTSMTPSYNENYDPSRKRTPSRAQFFSNKAADSNTFDFSKFMDSNVRRSSDYLPKLGQLKTTKGV